MLRTSRGAPAGHSGGRRARSFAVAVALGAGAVTGVIAPAPAGAQNATPPLICTANTAGAAAAFTDVPSSSPHKAAIDCLVFHKVANGKTATTFAPAAGLSRAQAASLLFRVTELAGKGWRSTRDHFSDDNGSVHEAAINALAENGIIRGVGGRRFAPNVPVTRDQAATLAVRSFELLMKAPMPAGTNAFDDDAGSTHEADINKAAAAGILNGTGARRYEPNRPLRRDEAASVMVRALEAMARAFTGAS